MAKNKQKCPNCGDEFVNLGTHQRFCGNEDSRDEDEVDELSTNPQGRTECCGAKVKTHYTSSRNEDDRKVKRICKNCGQYEING